VAMVPAGGHVGSDVMHDRGDLEQQPLPFPHPVLRVRRVEYGTRERGRVEPVALVRVVLAREVQGRRDRLLGKKHGRAALDRLSHL